MITLNGERGFETVESWDDILALPGFVEELDPKSNKLKQIIGRYLFKEYISCGLSTCRQPHGKGYVVTTASGQVTNIGNGCGKTHFGVDFQEQSKIFERSLTEHNNREKLASFMFQLDEHLEYIASIKKAQKGANWVYKRSKDLTNKERGVPETIISKIHQLVRSRTGTLIKERQATEAEVKDMEAIQNKALPRPQYIEVSIGTIKGIEALYPENDIRNLVILDLEENLKVISEIDLDNTTYKDLQYWSKWISNFDVKLEYIDSIY